jgi:Restriction endonuclease
MAQVQSGRMQNAGAQTWRSYELVVQGIFQLLVDQTSVHNVRVEHDVTLQGKSATHQIDVYWTFEMAGVPYETIVEVKDWSKPVEQERLFCFKSVLDDLPGSPKGIFVTRSGYQSGAEEYAAAHGIILYKLDESRPNNLNISTLGWARCDIIRAPLRGSPKNEEIAAQEHFAIGWQWTVFTPHCSDLRFQHDKAWLEQDLLMSNLDISTFKLLPMLFRDIILYDENHTVVSNVALVLRQAIEGMREESSDKKTLVHTFERPTFLGPPVTDPFYIKVNSVSANIKIESTVLPMRFFGNSKFVQFVLHQISSGKTQSFFRLKK